MGGSHWLSCRWLQTLLFVALSSVLVCIAAAHSAPATYAELSRSTVLFAMIGRDVAGELKHVLGNIERLASFFQRAHVLLVENDSRDGTIEVFNSWSMQSNLSAELRHLPPNQGGKKHLNTLAKARNVYLQAVSEDKYKDVQYLIPVDTDMCYEWKQHRMAHVLEALWTSTDWDAAFGNGVCGNYDVANGNYRGSNPLDVRVPLNPVYCDLFALQDVTGLKYVIGGAGQYSYKTGWYPGTCGNSIDYANNNHTARDYWGCSLLNKQAVVPVMSAFGGFAVYKTAALRAHPECVYYSEHGECEHMPLNQCLHAAGAKLYIATGLVVEWEGCV